MLRTLFWFLFNWGVASQTFTQQRNPIISSVSPDFGSVEGGSDIIIYGANFASATLFTEVVVYIGNDRCAIDGYHTDDMRIACRTPPCRSEACTSKNLYAGETKMDIKVYVSGVEGILTTSYSSFRYLNYQTPNVWQMPSAAWGSATSWIVAYARTGLLADIGIALGDSHRADLGSDGELNADSFSASQTEKTFFYRVPEDVVSGFYNLSFNVRDSEHSGGVGTGNGRMFENDRLNNDVFNRFPLFASSLAGTTYTTCVYPSISSVSRANGSMAGGTLLTVRGGGFSASAAELEVLVGGLPCAVVSAAVDSIQCVTRAAVSDAAAAAEVASGNLDLVEPDLAAAFGQTHSPARRLGSHGWWLKFWDYGEELNGRVGEEERIAVQFGWRDRFYFSMYDYFSNRWDEVFGVSTSNLRFTQDAAAVLVAPYSGYYTFRVACDDRGQLFGARASTSSPGEFDPETLLAYTNSYVSDKSYFMYPTQVSAPVALQKGEHYMLRLRVVNTGSYDFSSIGLRITPAFTAEGLLEGPLWAGDPMPDEAALDDYISATENRTLREVYTSNFPEALLHHHSKKAIQVLSLSMDFWRETQVVSFRNVTGGRFQLVVQGRVVTEPIDLAASTATIRNALYYAATQIPAADRECTYFSIRKRTTSNGVDISVQFDVDTVGQKTMLVGVDFDLAGSDPDVAVSREREHSPLPSGGFSINLPGSSSGDITIPYAASADTVEDRIESTLGETFNVEVTRSGFSLSGYSWTVTFVTPRSDVSVLEVKSIDIFGPNENNTVLQVTSRVNASSTELFFDHIPAWMTEVPVEWATGGTVRSVVEVYRTAPGGDRLKAVCDHSGEVGSSLSTLMKGEEGDCSFNYVAALTPIITSTYVVAFVDRVTTRVGINGTGFSFGANNFKGIHVSIGGQPCNISLISDERIVCDVSSVPWGLHTVEVLFPDVGRALNIGGDRLEFKQAIYSMDVLSGSMAGGQRVNISGRGFRKNATISLGLGEDCIVEYYSTSNIVIVTPPLEPKPVTFCSIEHPSSMPTGTPSADPSSVPTGIPFSLPTSNPSFGPTGKPSGEPTVNPTGEPSVNPTGEPTSSPSGEPSSLPSTEGA